MLSWWLISLCMVLTRPIFLHLRTVFAIALSLPINNKRAFLKARLPALLGCMSSETSGSCGSFLRRLISPAPKKSGTRTAGFFHVCMHAEPGKTRHHTHQMEAFKGMKKKKYREEKETHLELLQRVFKQDMFIKQTLFFHIFKDIWLNLPGTMTKLGPSVQDR